MRTGAACSSLAVNSSHAPAGKMDEEQRTRVQGAVTILMGVTHEAVARCLGTWTEADGRLCAVEEYGIRGDLFTEMYSERWALCTRAKDVGETASEVGGLHGAVPAMAWPQVGGAGLGGAWQLRSGGPRGVF